MHATMMLPMAPDRKE
jgi:hypothetical protein